MTATDAAAVSGLRFTSMQMAALVKLIDAPATDVGPRCGVSASAIRHRKRRALAKLTPEQRELYERSLNRRRNRKQVKPLGGVGLLITSECFITRPDRTAG